MKKLIETVFYRGGSDFEILPVSMTAKDIINYEKNELGNADIEIVTGKDLNLIPARKCRWVTLKRKDAAEYGNPITKYETLSYEIIAKDKYGGILIHDKEEV